MSAERVGRVAVPDWAAPRRAPQLLALPVGVALGVAAIVLQPRLALARTWGERARSNPHGVLVVLALAAPIGPAVALSGVVDERLAIVRAWVLAATFLAPMGLAFYERLVAYGRDRMRHDAELRDAGTVARVTQD